MYMLNSSFTGKFPNPFSKEVPRIIAPAEPLTTQQPILQSRPPEPINIIIKNTNTQNTVQGRPGWSHFGALIFGSFYYMYKGLWIIGILTLPFTPLANIMGLFGIGRGNLRS